MNSTVRDKETTFFLDFESDMLLSLADVLLWPTFKTHFQATRKIMQKVRTKTMQDSSLSANVIQSKLDTMQRYMVTLQESQHTVLGTIDQNQSVINQVTNHIHQGYHDGRNSIIQYNEIPV